MDIDKKTKELAEASGVIALLSSILANPTAAAVTKNATATQFDLMEAQVNMLQLFEAVGGMLIVIEKEIKELKARLQVLELRQPTVNTEVPHRFS